MLKAEQVVSLLAEFFSGKIDGSARFQDIERKMCEMRKNVEYVPVALELLQREGNPRVVWFSVSVLEHLALFRWVPRSMTSDPRQSQISPDVKHQIRDFLVLCMNERIDQLEIESANFIYRLIVILMKVDFGNEGVFWLSYARDNIGNPNCQHKCLIIMRYMSDNLQIMSDRTVATSMRNGIKQAFTEVVLTVLPAIIGILSVNGGATRSLMEALLFVKSLVQWLGPRFMSVDLVRAITANSRCSVPTGGVACIGHDCIYAMFSRIDIGLGSARELRNDLMRTIMEFFVQEMRIFESSNIPTEFAESLLRAFLPIASNIIIVLGGIEPGALMGFLGDFERWTWMCFGSPIFGRMLEVWGCLLDGSDMADNTSENGFYPVFRLVAEHVLEAMTDPERIPKFTEEDFVIANDFISELATGREDDSMRRLVQRATAFVVNAGLPSVEPLLMCLGHVVYSISGDDPANESISDSLIKYANELMTTQINVDVAGVFPAVTRIVKMYVRKFSSNSKHFLEKIFYLVTVALNAGPDFLRAMMEVLLETVTIERPSKPCKIILGKLLGMRGMFCSTVDDIYSLYVCCCVTIAASASTDGGSEPVAGLDTMNVIFELVFRNLRSPQVGASLRILKDVIDKIAFSMCSTKELVFQAILPNIDAVKAVYESPRNEEIIGPLLGFIASYCRVFMSRISDHLSGFVGGLFAPLAPVLPSLVAGTFEDTATIAFLNILEQLSSSKGSGAEQQTDNIVGFLLAYSKPLLHGESVEVMRVTLTVVGMVIRDRWLILSSENKMNMLSLAFLHGVCSDDPDAVKISINALKDGQRFHRILTLVTPEFRSEIFCCVCKKMCASSSTIMRDMMIEFLDVVFCTVESDFRSVLLVPFVRSLPISPGDMDALLQAFVSANPGDFQRIFSMFCDDVAYLLAAQNA